MQTSKGKKSIIDAHSIQPENSTKSHVKYVASLILVHALRLRIINIIFYELLRMCVMVFFFFFFFFFCFFFLLDIICIRFGTKLYKQTIGIPMAKIWFPCCTSVSVLLRKNPSVVPSHRNQADVNETFSSTSPLRKHADSNILKISPPNTEKFQIQNLIFSYFC